MFGDQISDEPIRPQPMEEKHIELEGHELVPMEIGQSDADISSILHVPSLKAMVGGDIGVRTSSSSTSASCCRTLLALGALGISRLLALSVVSSPRTCGESGFANLDLKAVILVRMVSRERIKRESVKGPLRPPDSWHRAGNVIARVQNPPATLRCEHLQPKVADLYRLGGTRALFRARSRVRGSQPPSVDGQPPMTILSQQSTWPSATVTSAKNLARPVY